MTDTARNDPIGLVAEELEEGLAASTKDEPEYMTWVFV